MHISIMFTYVTSSLRNGLYLLFQYHVKLNIKGGNVVSNYQEAETLYATALSFLNSQLKRAGL
jgi:hypothetical protein